jgi:acetoin utilization deacetylase AcuC-like enzyme
MATGYVFDDIFTKHDLPGHPESAHRLFAVMDYLGKNDLLARLISIPSRPATREELMRCHHPRHIERVEEISRRGGGMLDADTYTNPFS